MSDHKKRYLYTCLYCDHQWGEDYNFTDRCLKCNDRNLKIRENNKIDFYEESYKEES